MRSSNNDTLEKAVFLWFMQERRKGTPISGPLIMQKARMIHSALYPDSSEDDFKASHGWLHRFKERHGIRQLKLQGEALSADSSALEPFKRKLHEFIETQQLTLHQLFNCDETGLFWRMLPNKTLADSSGKNSQKFQATKRENYIISCCKCIRGF